VTIELQLIENGHTELTLMHENILKQEDGEALNKGWQSCLEKLSSILKTNN
jgi:hypothetical protein